MYERRCAMRSKAIFMALLAFAVGAQAEPVSPETAEAAAYGPVLCEPDMPVTFEAVVKPSESAGFFSIGARAVRE